MIRRSAARSVATVLALLSLGAAAFFADRGGPASAIAGDDVDVASLEKGVAAVRQLAFRKPVAVVHLPAEKAQERLSATLDETLGESEAASQAAALAELELTPFGYPLRAKLEGMLFEQVAGFYDPRRKELAIVEFPPDHPAAALVANEAVNRYVLAHEIAHALVDQYYDLTTIVEKPALERRDDVVMARRALAEGDATLAGLLLALQQQGLALSPENLPAAGTLREMAAGSQLPALANAPTYLKALLVEPYAMGIDLVGAAWRGGGWPAVDALWKNPPSSTEQLLHPDRRNDEPRALPPAPLREGSMTATTFELGELGMRVWLSNRLGREKAEAAAAGWGGDRVDLERDAAGVQRLWLRSVWDSRAEAAEFAAAAEAWLRAAKLDEIDGEGAWSLYLDGDAVTIKLRAGASRAPVDYVEPDSDEREPVIDLPPEPEFPELR